MGECSCLHSHTSDSNKITQFETCQYYALELYLLVKIRQNTFISSIIDYLVKNNKNVIINYNKNTQEVVGLFTKDTLSESEIDKIPININVNETTQIKSFGNIYFNIYFIKDGKMVITPTIMNKTIVNIIDIKYKREIRSIINDYVPDSKVSTIQKTLDEIEGKSISTIVDDNSSKLTKIYTYLDSSRNNDGNTYIDGTYGYIKLYQGLAFGEFTDTQLQEGTSSIADTSCPTTNCKNCTCPNYPNCCGCSDGKSNSICRTCTMGWSCGG